MREWLPTPVFLHGEFRGQRNQAGYSPWGHQESDMIEQLSLIKMDQQLGTDFHILFIWHIEIPIKNFYCLFYLFLVALGLGGFAQAFSSCGKQGLLSFFKIYLF